MLVNAAAHPAPAMWQGLAFLGAAIWMLWLFNLPPGKSSKAPNIFLAVYIVAITVLVVKIFYLR